MTTQKTGTIKGSGTALPPTVQEIDDLLPFYVNGSLPEAERRRIEAALAKEPDFARRLTLVEEEAAAATLANEALGAPSPRVFEALMAKIEAEPKSAAHVAQSVKRGLSERFGAFMAALSPRTLAYVTTAAVGVIALQGVMLSGLVNTAPRGPASFEVASAPPAAAGSHALVSFAPEAKAGDIAALLKASGISIVEGPRASGLYRVRLSEKPLPKEEVGRILATLQAAPGVVAFTAPEQ